MSSKNPLAMAAGWLIVAVVVIGMLTGGVAGCSSFNRYQATQNAHNKATNSIIAANATVQTTEIEIQNHDQLIKIAKQDAQIKYEQAVGIRAAQDEIAKTLTPLYVQYEMVQALTDIAKSGTNNTVVYVPSGPGGVPTITANAATGK